MVLDFTHACVEVCTYRAGCTGLGSHKKNPTLEALSGQKGRAGVAEKGSTVWSDKKDEEGMESH